LTRISAIVLIAAVATAPTQSLAREGAPPRGTNSAGTAKSSGGTRHRNDDTGGLGTGHAKPPETPSADAVINQENAVLDRKLKSICRGC
jgi:hypothetical protein